MEPCGTPFIRRYYQSHLKQDCVHISIDCITTSPMILIFSSSHSHVPKKLQLILTYQAINIQHSKNSILLISFLYSLHCKIISFIYNLIYILLYKFLSRIDHKVYTFLFNSMMKATKDILNYIKVKFKIQLKL